MCLATNQLIESSDITTCLDVRPGLKPFLHSVRTLAEHRCGSLTDVQNEALYKICTQELKLSAPGHKDLNGLIAKVMAGFTSTSWFLIHCRSLLCNGAEDDRCEIGGNAGSMNRVVGIFRADLVRYIAVVSIGVLDLIVGTCSGRAGSRGWSQPLAGTTWSGCWDRYTDQNSPGQLNSDLRKLAVNMGTFLPP